MIPSCAAVLSATYTVPPGSHEERTIQVRAICGSLDEYRWKPKTVTTTGLNEVDLLVLLPNGSMIHRKGRILLQKETICFLQ